MLKPCKNCACRVCLVSSKKMCSSTCCRQCVQVHCKGSGWRQLTFRVFFLALLVVLRIFMSSIADGIASEVGSVKTLIVCCKPSRLGDGVENRKFPKVDTRGCKRCFGPREQRSPKGLLHLPKAVLHRCNPILHQCKRLFARWVQKTFCPLS